MAGLWGGPCGLSRDIGWQPIAPCTVPRSIALEFLDIDASVPGIYGGQGDLMKSISDSAYHEWWQQHASRESRTTIHLFHKS
jgi:hypothetical protein